MKRLPSDPHAYEILEYYKARVWPIIRDKLKAPKYPYHFRIPSKYKPEDKYHWETVMDYPKRQGKYLRPTLLILTAEAMGMNRNKALLGIAAAMQVSEDWILIHDDIQDGSTLRRGKPALHRRHSSEIAINSGDALHLFMWKLILDHKNYVEDKIYNKLYEEFFTMLTRTAIGQTIELKWLQENKRDMEDEDWFFIADSKSAYYSIAGPMRLGAIMAGANKKQLAAITKFGLYLGRAFQLVDDVLDLTSNFEGNKQWANDIYEGKRTVILAHLLRNAGKRDKKKILKIINKKREEITEDEVRFVLERMTKYKSIIYAQELINYKKVRAKKIFDKDLKFLKNDPARQRLEKLIHFITEREY